MVDGIAKSQALKFTFQGVKFPVKSLVLLVRRRIPQKFQALKFQISGPEIWRIHPPPFHTPPFACPRSRRRFTDTDTDLQLTRNYFVTGTDTPPLSTLHLCLVRNLPICNSSETGIGGVKTYRTLEGGGTRPESCPLQSLDF